MTFGERTEIMRDSDELLHLNVCYKGYKEQISPLHQMFDVDLTTQRYRILSTLTTSRPKPYATTPLVSSGSVERVTRDSTHSVRMTEDSRESLNLP